MTDQPAETEGFVLNQTMIRIKDPVRSLDFYQQVLGMALYQRCLLYTSPSPRDVEESRMPSSA